MRRKDKARYDQKFMNEVLNAAEEIYIGFTNADAPYVIPLNFVYLQDKIYFHCAHEGRKIECIKADARVGFCAATGISILREEASTKYCCINGAGKAYIVVDVEEKRAALNAIAKRYMAQCEIPATDKMVERTAIVRIDIEQMCGKQSPPVTRSS